MKKALITLVALCALGLSTARADYFVGYDEDSGCPIYYSNYAGFYSRCYDVAPAYFGWNFGGYDWGYWRGHRGQFHGNRWHGQNQWNGHGGNWHGGMAGRPRGSPGHNWSGARAGARAGYRAGAHAGHGHGGHGH